MDPNNIVLRAELNKEMNLTHSRIDLKDESPNKISQEPAYPETDKSYRYGVSSKTKLEFENKSELKNGDKRNSWDVL